MRGGFHGRTLATVTATAQEKYHHGFEPLPGGFKYVAYDDLRAVERAIDSRTAAVLVEPIQGEGGVMVPGDGYLPGLRKLCDEAGILLILDEIQTGMGRTGRLWAYEHYGGGAGHHDGGQGPRQWRAHRGDPGHATRWRRPSRPARTGAPSAATRSPPRSGSPCWAPSSRSGCPSERPGSGASCTERLVAVQERHPRLVTDVRGRGLLVALDLVPPVGDVVTACRERGLLALTAGDNALRLAPPLVLDEADAEQGAAIVERSLAAVAPA